MIAACLTAAASLPAFLCTPSEEPPPPPPAVVVLTPERPYGPAALPAPVPEPEPEFTVPDHWYALAVCESGMGGVPRWDYNGSSGHDGGIQFSPRTWTAFGGGEFAPEAWQATPEQQILVGERVLAEQGPNAWPACTRKLGLTSREDFE